MSLALPQRQGSRPRTRDGIPHQQLSDNPSPELHARTKARFLGLPETEVGPSLISVPGATAHFLPEGCACNPDAFFRGREFAHIHPIEDGSFHMSLSEEDCAAVIAAGWGELHPLARRGQLAPTVVMVYAPRDDAEIEVVQAIARASLAFAQQSSHSEPAR